MNKKLILLFAIFLFTSHLAYAQDDDSETQQPAKEGQEGAGAGEEYRLEGQDGEINQQEIYRANLVSCILLHRHEFHAHNEELSEILKEKKNAKEIYTKMVGEYMYNCFGQIQYHESQKIMQELQNKEFVSKNYEHITKFDYSKFTNSDVDLTLSPDEKRLVEYTEEFEKQMKEQYGEQGQETDQDEEQAGPKVIDPEPKIFGIAARDLPKPYILGYFAFVILVIAGGLYIAYRRLINPPKSVYEKARESSIDKKKKKKKPE